MRFPRDIAFGARPDPDGVRFTIWSGAAERVDLCLFDAEGRAETDRLAFEASGDGAWSVDVPGLRVGARYGLRADGPWSPRDGMLFDPAKLLVDPHALELDRPFAWDPRLALPREAAIDTADLVPKAIVTDPAPAMVAPPLFRPGGLIYEVPVRAFTMLHPDVPEHLRGTVAALAHPAVLEHLVRLGVDAVELMPVTAWIDERHLAPLGLRNAWGYNPVALMALDPRLCPGGVAELRATVAALREAGIGTILDLVFNHTGESDVEGPTLSLRGLDAAAYYRRGPDGALVNDTGCGNTLDCAHPATRRLVLDALRHFVERAGVDGFRFDLAPVLGRDAEGFDPRAPLLREIAGDPVLADRILIAEPWDVGPHGYRLGEFPPPFLEWNDRARDGIRRFWRGDAGATGDFATALAGSDDVFAPPETRGVAFVAAHDGMTLADLTAYERKRNHANGEGNRDGHDHDISWNCGVEGPTDDPDVLAARDRDRRALLGTLFAARGTIMLTAGDEFGRSQDGNNNAYAQDDATTWLDWAGRDAGLEAHCAALSALRRGRPELADPRFLTGAPGEEGIPDVEWLRPDGGAMTAGDWEAPDFAAFAMAIAGGRGRLAVLFNRGDGAVRFALPPRPGFRWSAEAPVCPARSVVSVAETRGPRPVAGRSSDGHGIAGRWSSGA